MVNLIKKIKKQGENLGFDLVSKKTMGENYSYVVANKTSQKAILLGQTNRGTLRCFRINMKKWIWAKDEGFSTDEMVNELFGEIFIEFEEREPKSRSDIDGIIDNLK